MPDVAVMFCELCFKYALLQYEVEFEEPEYLIPAITHASIINENSIELVINHTTYVLTRNWTIRFTATAGGYIEVTRSGQTLLSIQIEESLVDDDSEVWNERVDEFIEGSWLDDFRLVYRQVQKRERQELNVTDVALALRNHIKGEGYHIQHQSYTTDKRIKIIAEHASRPGRLLIDVRAGPGGRKGKRLFGEGFDRSQALNRVAKGFYGAVRMYSRERENGDRVAMAYPDTEWFRHYLEPIKPTVDGLGIAVFLVRSDRSVAEF